MHRKTTLIVIHCSASPNGDSLFRGSLGQPGFTTPINTIDAWHAERGFLRDVQARRCFNPDLAAIGYHYVIYRNGVSVSGRAEQEPGAHAKGYNQKSLGICLIGTDQYTPEQWQTLRELITLLQKRYPDARIVGHRDLSPDRNGNGGVEPDEWTKTCPGFDVAEWLGSGMLAPTKEAQ